MDFQDNYDSVVLLEVSIEENDDSSIEDILNERNEIVSALEELEFSKMFGNKMDPSSAFVEIQSGSGGTEAQDWAEMLLRMYTKWAESRGFGMICWGKIGFKKFLFNPFMGFKLATG